MLFPIIFLCCLVFVIVAVKIILKIEEKDTFIFKIIYYVLTFLMMPAYLFLFFGFFACLEMVGKIIF